MELPIPGAFDRALLSNEHAAIMQVADALLTACDADVLHIGLVSGLRWRLAHLLAKHLAREDRCVYPVLGRHRDPAVAALAKAFAAEMGGLNDAYRAYMRRWDAGSMAADHAGFMADTRAVIDALSRRVEREEFELYPRLTDGA